MTRFKPAALKLNSSTETIRALYTLPTCTLHSTSYNSAQCTLHCSIVHCSTVHSALQYSAQCTAVQCTAVQCTVHCSTVHSAVSISWAICPYVRRDSLWLPPEAVRDELLGLLGDALEQLGREVQRGGGDVPQRLLVSVAAVRGEAWVEDTSRGS